VLNQFGYIEMKVPVPEYFIASISTTGNKFTVNWYSCGNHADQQYITFRENELMRLVVSLAPTVAVVSAAYKGYLYV